jgi:hypothetical protein
MEQVPRDGEAQGMASGGQGERAAEDYDDHGEPELPLDRDDAATS